MPVSYCSNCTRDKCDTRSDVIAMPVDPLRHASNGTVGISPESVDISALYSVYRDALPVVVRKVEKYNENNDEVTLGMPKDYPDIPEEKASFDPLGTLMEEMIPPVIHCERVKRAEGSD